MSLFGYEQIMSDLFDDAAWFTTAEAQNYLKISKSTLYECMKDGRLPFYYVQGTRQRRIKKTDLDNLMVKGDPDAQDEDL